MEIRFEWDNAKAASNYRKHGIAFETAAKVWLDPNRLEIQDRWENGEERWQSTGMVGGQLILLVAHTIRNENQEDIVRIISARKAEKKERRMYEQQ